MTPPQIQSLTRLGTIESDRGSNPTVPMFCVNCGRKYQSSDKFCNFCGHPISSDHIQEQSTPIQNENIEEKTPATPAPIKEAQTEAPSIEPQSASVALSERTTSYSSFALQLLVAALFVSVIVFDIADEFARGQRHPTLLSLISAIVFVFVAIRLSKRWRELRDTDRKLDITNVKRLFYRGLVFTVLFMATAGLVGYEIGVNGNEAAQMTANFGTMSLVGDRISQARSGVDRTIASHIGMYKIIEPDVQKFDAVLQKLRTEVAVYDEKFPNQHDQTTKTIHSIETGIKRAVLLKKQIEVARALESLDSDTQWNEWQREMQPLLDAEDALDKSK